MFLEDDSFISDWEDTKDLKTKISYAFASESSTSAACWSASCDALAQSASLFCVLFLFGINEGDQKASQELSSLSLWASVATDCCYWTSLLETLVSGAAGGSGWPQPSC